MADDIAQQACGDDSAAQPGDAWGDPISEERQVELRALFERQKVWVFQPETTREASVFKGVELSGADVCWLAEWSGRSFFEAAPDLHVGEANLRAGRLQGADLRKAHLKGVNLRAAQLERAVLAGAHLERADLRAARLQGANLTSATFDKATLLNAAVLTKVLLDQVTYDGVNLTVVDWSRVPILGDELAAQQIIDCLSIDETMSVI